MEANEFKNYILGLIFYRYLSEKVENRVNDLLSEDNISYLEAFEDKEYREGLQEELIEQLGYFIEPKSEEEFDHLFDDMDLSSTKLGRDVKTRSKLIAKVMANIAEIDFVHEDSEIDVLGDAYEYLISQFAANAGKKAGEFYTPQQVSKILAKIVTVGKTDLRDVYDPTCGSGSLLLRVSN